MKPEDICMIYQGFIRIVFLGGSMYTRNQHLAIFRHAAYTFHHVVSGSRDQTITVSIIFEGFHGLFFMYHSLQYVIFMSCNAVVLMCNIVL